MQVNLFREIIDRIKEAGEYIIRSRLVTLIVVFLLTSAILLGRLFYLQIVRGEDYLENYELQIRKTRDIAATRGNIYDRNGTVLATSEKVYNLILDPGVLWEYHSDDAAKDCVEPTLQALVNYFGQDRAELDRIMQENADSHYVVLEKQLTKWQSVKVDYGGWAMGIVFVFILIVVGWMVYKLKK